MCVTTDRGDVVVQLFPEDAPRACENFVALVRRGYYAQAAFFRVIKGFMVQTGDPTNTGTGGESSFGAEFDDEVVPHRTFAAPGVLAMANAGPRTNGSQFFITVGACPWLDGKHTIFGRVVKGFDVVKACVGGRRGGGKHQRQHTAPLTPPPFPPSSISSVKVGKEDRPFEIPKILSARVL